MSGGPHGRGKAPERGSNMPVGSRSPAITLCQHALAPLRTYLHVHRPVLAAINRLGAKPAGKALWVSSRGSPLTEMTMYNTIRKHTQEAFGQAINPHLFRDAAATTLAIADPAHVRVAAPLLGYRTFTTTERHYQQAQSLTHIAPTSTRFSGNAKRP